MVLSVQGKFRRSVLSAAGFFSRVGTFSWGFDSAGELDSAGKFDSAGCLFQPGVRYSSLVFSGRTRRSTLDALDTPSASELSREWVTRLSKRSFSRKGLNWPLFVDVCLAHASEYRSALMAIARIMDFSRSALAPFLEALDFSHG